MSILKKHFDTSNILKNKKNLVSFDRFVDVLCTLVLKFIILMHKY